MDPKTSHSGFFFSFESLVNHVHSTYVLTPSLFDGSVAVLPRDLGLDNRALKLVFRRPSGVDFLSLGFFGAAALVCS